MENKIKVYWLVIIFLGVLCVFIFINIGVSSDDLVKYLSFAGTIVSIILGVIAIFYSIITNNQSADNFAKLKDVVNKIEEGATTIKNVSTEINTKIDKIPDDLEEALAKFGEKGNTNQVSPKTNLTTEKPIVNDPTADLPDESLNDINEKKEESDG